MGVVGTSRKEDEKRVPVHPDHLTRLPEDIRRQLIFEKGYGAPFGLDDEFYVSQTGGVASRQELLTDLGSVIIAKPVLAIYRKYVKEGLYGVILIVPSKAASHKQPLTGN